MLVVLSPLGATINGAHSWIVLPAGFEIQPGVHPIVPIMLYDERLAHDMARRLLDRGIYVIGFSYPVVPKGLARIRVQVSAAHERKHLERAVEAFTQVGHDLGVLKGAAR